MSFQVKGKFIYNSYLWGLRMTDSSADTQKNESIDRFGAVASSLCALHCAICALLPAAFGVLGLGMLLNQEVEWMFTMIAVSFAFVALVLVIRQNRSYAVAGLLCLGIIGLLTSRGLEMGSDHHHDEHHAEHNDDHKDKHDGEHNEDHKEEHDGEHHDEPKDKHDGEHHAEHTGEDHSDSMHSLGASMGVLGGVLLLLGHLLNIRSIRSLQKDDCCD